MEYETKEKIEQFKLILKEDENYRINNEKDKSFKGLFEVKKQFIQLIKTFVKEEWVKELTDDKLELADKEFILPNMHETRADIIYRIKNKNIYFVLLEFQSTEDKNMPYRLLSYIMEIWRRYSCGKLPLVIPCVLYTGNKPWKVKTLRKTFKVNKEIEKYIPDFEYILIDVNCYSDEELIKTANLVSSIVYMSKSRDKIEVVSKLENIVGIISKLNKEDQKAFIKWTERVFFKYNEVYDYFEEKIYKKEDKDMALADLVPEAMELIRERAREEVRGKERREIIIRMLSKKLNHELDKEKIDFINNASNEELEKIEDSIFEIGNWQEVINIIKKQP